MDITPDITYQPSAGKTLHPPKPHVISKLRKLAMSELRDFPSSADNNHTDGHVGEDVSVNREPSTEKWTSPLLEKIPNLLSKLATVSGKSEQMLKPIVERVVVPDPSDYPWCTVGKVFVGWNNNFDAPIKSGSGVLVGPNLLLTASHVVPWGKPGPWLRFVPAYTNGTEPFGSSFVTESYGVENTEDVDGLDCAICILSTALGNSLGWMGTLSFGDDSNYYGRLWISVGYPALAPDYSAEVQIVDSVTVDDVDGDGDGKALESNYLYSVPGWSGGPLWNYIEADGVSAHFVIGVMSGFEDSLWFIFGEKDDVNAGGDHMVNLVKWGYQNFPA